MHALTTILCYISLMEVLGGAKAWDRACSLSQAECTHAKLHKLASPIGGSAADNVFFISDMHNTSYTTPPSHDNPFASSYTRIKYVGKVTACISDLCCSLQRDKR
jgi:hypothetical protein